jgi:hypothetical protein
LISFFVPPVTKNELPRKGTRAPANSDSRLEIRKAATHENVIPAA